MSHSDVTMLSDSFQQLFAMNEGNRVIPGESCFFVSVQCSVLFFVPVKLFVTFRVA